MKKGEKTKEETPGQKSFNQAYISLILKSEDFRDKVDFYINNLITQQINEERQSKIQKFIQNMTKKYISIEKDVTKNKKSNKIRKNKDSNKYGFLDPNSTNQDYLTVEGQFNHQTEVETVGIKDEKFNKIVKLLENYIQTNSKLKLPWTDSQINQAIDLAKQTIKSSRE